MFLYCFLSSPCPLPTGALEQKQKMPMETVFYLLEREALHIHAHGQGTSMVLGTNSSYISALRMTSVTTVVWS